MAFDNHANLAVSTVAVLPSPAVSGTSLTVASGEGARFPAAPFNCTIAPIAAQPTPANAEIVRVTARTGDVFTITRAQEGTTARTVQLGDLIAATITAKTVTDIETGTGTTVALTKASGTNTSPTSISLVQYAVPPLGALDTLKIYITMYQGAGTGGAVYVSAYGDAKILRLDDMGGGSLAAGRFGTWDLTMRTDPNNGFVRVTMAVGGTLPVNTADTSMAMAARGSAVVLTTASWFTGWLLALDANSSGAMTQYWQWAVYRLT